MSVPGEHSEIHANDFLYMYIDMYIYLYIKKEGKQRIQASGKHTMQTKFFLQTEVYKIGQEHYLDFAKSSSRDLKRSAAFSWAFILASCISTYGLYLEV